MKENSIQDLTFTIKLEYFDRNWLFLCDINEYGSETSLISWVIDKEIKYGLFWIFGL